MSKDLAQRRFISIPFSFGCRSHSSVDVVDTARHAAEKPQAGELGTATGKGESLVARLLRGFKSLSQIFAVYDEDDDEEEAREMVIGLPTDVKHVAHIGWDGSTNTTSSVRSWNRAAPPPPASTASTSTAPPQQQEQHPLPLPPLSMRQFELAMAAQAAGGAGTTPGSSSTSTASHRRHS